MQQPQDRLLVGGVAGFNNNIPLNGNVGGFEVAQSAEGSFDQQLLRGDIVLTDQEVTNFLYNTDIQNWEIPSLPDGGIPVQQPAGHPVANNGISPNTPNALANIGGPHPELPDEEGSNDNEAVDDQPNNGAPVKNQAAVNNQDGANGQPNPALRMCDENGCQEPTYHQTNRARKCRYHHKNKTPRSRLPDREAVTTANPMDCSGCNGRNQRRAPGRNCWQCYCKWKSLKGGCAGCPGCPVAVPNQGN